MQKVCFFTFVVILALSVAHAQGPECKTGPNPSILAIQQNCAKGSLLCKELQVDVVQFDMDSPQRIVKVVYTSIIPNLLRKETQYATVLSANDGSNAYFLFPVTNNLADPKPVLVTAPMSQGQQPRTLPVTVVNSTALLYLHTLGKLVLITQDDVFTVDTTTGVLTPNNIPFPGTGFFNSGVATTDGSTIFLLFGEDPQQTDTPHWFVCMIDIMQHTLVRGSSRSAALLPVAFHFNPRANGTMILSAMMHEIEGADPIQVGTLNPYNSTEWVKMWEYDGGYYPDASPISNLPEGIPSALSQQMSALVGDYFYATLDIQPQKATRSNDDAQWSATYINMYLGDVTTHLKPRPWSCYNPFPRLNDNLQYTAFVWPNVPPGVRAMQPAIAPESKDDTCGGNCPNGCSSCPCGSTPAIIDSGHWCSQGLSSGWEQDSCECIIQASSRLNAAASTERFDGSFNLGMFQTWAAVNTTSGCDPADSVKAAVSAFEAGGKTWKLWSTCIGCGVCAGP